MQEFPNTSCVSGLCSAKNSASLFPSPFTAGAGRAGASLKCKEPAGTLCVPPGDSTAKLNDSTTAFGLILLSSEAVICCKVFCTTGAPVSEGGRTCPDMRHFSTSSVFLWHSAELLPEVWDPHLLLSNLLGSSQEVGAFLPHNGHHDQLVAMSPCRAPCCLGWFVLSFFPTLP